jgi:hypothetical protein
MTDLYTNHGNALMDCTNDLYQVFNQVQARYNTHIADNAKPRVIANDIATMQSIRIARQILMQAVQDFETLQ